MGDREAFRPRSDFLGPALSDGQRLRPAVRRERILVRRHADPRSEDAQGDVLKNAGRRSQCAGVVRPSAPWHGRPQSGQPLGLLGRREDLEPAGQQSQQHVRQEGPRVAGGGGARHRKSGLLPEGVGPSVGQGLPARTLRPASDGVRSQNPEIQLHRYLLRHPSPAIRLRCRRYALGLGDRPGRRLGQHQAMGRDRRCRQSAGLGAVRSRHQRQRQGRRIHRAGRAGAGGQGHAGRRLRPLRRDAASDRRLGLVHRQRVRRPTRLHALRSQDQSCRNFTPFRRKASASAAATSTRTACSGARARTAA